jgi:glutamate synthase domain-containing protein 3
MKNAVHCLGERYIGCGHSGPDLILKGTPGNALGAYLNGASIRLYGNAQDATGDTMNEGTIVIHGSTGDAVGYSMRGGAIYVRDNAGCRAGIHMKASADKVPVLVIGGSCGSFLGEYLAGGYLVVLGLNTQGESPVGDFCGTGMHGGKIYLRTDVLPNDLPAQVVVSRATQEDLAEIMPIIETYCGHFGAEKAEIMSRGFYVLTPNTKNPYKQLYCAN